MTSPLSPSQQPLSDSRWHDQRTETYETVKTTKNGREVVEGRLFRTKPINKHTQAFEQAQIKAQVAKVLEAARKAGDPGARSSNPPSLQGPDLSAAPIVPNSDANLEGVPERAGEKMTLCELALSLGEKALGLPSQAQRSAEVAKNALDASSTPHRPRKVLLKAMAYGQTPVHGPDGKTVVGYSVRTEPSGKEKVAGLLRSFERTKA